MAQPLFDGTSCSQAAASCSSETVSRNGLYWHNFVTVFVCPPPQTAACPMLNKQRLSNCSATESSVCIWSRRTERHCFTIIPHLGHRYIIMHAKCSRSKRFTVPECHVLLATLWWINECAYGEILCFLWQCGCPYAKWSQCVGCRSSLISFSQEGKIPWRATLRKESKWEMYESSWD